MLCVTLNNSPHPHGLLVNCPSCVVSWSCAPCPACCRLFPSCMSCVPCWTGPAQPPHSTGTSGSSWRTSVPACLWRSAGGAVCVGVCVCVCVCGCVCFGGGVQILLHNTVTCEQHHAVVGLLAFEGACSSHDQVVCHATNIHLWPCPWHVQPATSQTGSRLDLGQG
jgi:hypothetical protein